MKKVIYIALIVTLIFTVYKFVEMKMSMEDMDNPTGMCDEKTMEGKVIQIRNNLIILELTEDDWNIDVIRVGVEDDSMLEYIKEGDNVRI